MTGALSAASLVGNPRVDGFAYILSLYKPFKQILLKIQQFLPPSEPSLVFIVRSYEDLSSWCWNLGLCDVSWGWDHSLPRFLSQFLSTTHDYETTCSATAATSACHTMSLRLSTCLCDSIPPTHLDECGFFKSLVAGLPYGLIFWWFRVLYVLRSS